MWMGRVSWIMMSLLRSGSVDHFLVARLVSALDRLAVVQGKDQAQAPKSPRSGS